MTKRLVAAFLLAAAATTTATPAHAGPCPPPEDIIDWATCAPCLVFDELSPTQVKDVVVIEPGGDVFVLGEAFWDCYPPGA